MLRLGIQRTLALVNSASANQTLACAAATIRGRASESRRAVARVIGKRKSVGANGAALSFRLVARGDGAVAVGPRARGVRAVVDGRGGKAGGKAWTSWIAVGMTAGGSLGGGRGDDPPTRPVRGSAAGRGVDGGK